MSQHHQIISFPFEPYLAKFTFNLSAYRLIETDTAYYNHLDIRMESFDDSLSRKLLQCEDIPGIKCFQNQGFRFTICLPKPFVHHAEINEVGRRNKSCLNQNIVQLIHDFFNKRFEDHFLSFAASAVQASESSYGGLTKAIRFFMAEYDLDKNAHYNVERLEALFKTKS